MRSLNKLGFALVLLLLALPAFAADLAILRNGFSIRHERRETLGAMTRLYLSTGKAAMSTLPPTRSSALRRT